ncbi:restriction endonuclease subunit S [Amycolatopsis coloradensis]|nr:restriction endonuclease subunit S [Amycolatopsis coloradensis]
MSWERIPLRHATVVLNRGTAPDYCEDGPVRMISQAANQGAGIDWNRTRFHAYDGDPRRLKGFLQPGDSFVNSTGTGTLGRVGWFSSGPDSRPCVADGHVTLVRFDPKHVHDRFGYFFLKSDSFQNFMFETLVFGSTNQIELSRERMLGVPICVPGVADQRAIVDFLDVETARIDALVAKKYQLIRVLAEWEQSEMLEIAGDWRRCDTVSLRQFGTSVLTGPFGTQLAASEYISGGVPVINPTHIKRGKITPEEIVSVAASAAARLSRHRLSAGDLVMGRKGDVGRTAIVDARADGWLCGSDSIAIRPSPERLIPAYLAMVMSIDIYRQQLMAKSTGATLANVNESTLKDLRVPHRSVVSQEECVRMAEHVNECYERLVSALEQQISLLREHRQALITAAVTGEMKVPGVS